MDTDNSIPVEVQPARPLGKRVRVPTARALAMMEDDLPEGPSQLVGPVPENSGLLQSQGLEVAEPALPAFPPSLYICI